MKYSTLSTAASLLLFSTVLAHDDTHESIHKRNEYISKRSLSSCRDNAKALELFDRSLERRSAWLNELRAERGLEARSLEESHLVAKRDLNRLSKLRRRDYDEFAAIDHETAVDGLSTDVDPSVLFSGNTSCLLTPETTEGPYFVSGEYIRYDISDNEPGIPLYLDIQLISISSCTPISSAYFDAWHTNATGVYSGIVARGNGLGPQDPSNLDTTFCRGVQFTTPEGVIKFKTIFPGHYTGRTTHIHLMSHRGGTIYPNGTYSGHGRVTHVGQLFFDESLREAVEEVEPYRSNTQNKISNDADGIAREQAENDYDPFVRYAYLGDSVSDGIMAWITVGVDEGEEFDPYVAVRLTEEGGEEVGGRRVVGTGEEVEESVSGVPPGPESTSGPGEGPTATGRPTGTTGGGDGPGTETTIAGQGETSNPNAGAKIGPQGVLMGVVGVLGGVGVLL